MSVRNLLYVFSPLATSHSSLATALLLQALFAVAANFRARHRHLHVKVSRNLFLQLFVQAALELAHLAAPQASHVDVIRWPVGLVLMPVAAQVQQIPLVDPA